MCFRLRWHLSCAILGPPPAEPLTSNPTYNPNSCLRYLSNLDLSTLGSATPIFHAMYVSGQIQEPARTHGQHAPSSRSNSSAMQSKESTQCYSRVNSPTNAAVCHQLLSPTAAGLMCVRKHRPPRIQNNSAVSFHFTRSLQTQPRTHMAPAPPTSAPIIPLAGIE